MGRSLLLILPRHLLALRSWLADLCLLSLALDAHPRDMRQRRSPADEAEALRISNAIDDELKVRTRIVIRRVNPDAICSASGRP